ncbi:MAG: hypothetical protein HY842_03005 [Bacteroidetes bacterium]|nr:hypothetical protein [Bacteroidota bacterium]
MQSIEVAKGVEIGFSDLVKSLRKLDTGSLEKLAGEIGKVVALRKQPTKAEREAQLVKEIKKKIPASILKYEKSLMTKLHNDTITKKEKEDLGVTINYLENLAAERLALLAELAKLRNESFDKVCAEFIKPKL